MYDVKLSDHDISLIQIALIEYAEKLRKNGFETSADDFIVIAERLDGVGIE